MVFMADKKKSTRRPKQGKRRTCEERPNNFTKTVCHRKDTAQDGLYKLEMSKGSVIRYDGKCDTKNVKFIGIIIVSTLKIKIKQQKKFMRKNN